MLPRLAIAAAMCVVLLTVRSTQAADRWLEVKSPNFVVYSDAKRASVTKLVSDLEAFRYYLGYVTNVKVTDSAIPLIIYAGGNRGSYRDLTQSRRTAGLYTNTPDGVYAYADVSKPNSKLVSGRQTLFHEYVHYFMAQFTSFNYPRWYREGFAEYLATFRIEDGTTYIGLIHQARVAELQSLGWMDFRYVFSAATKIKGYGPFYAQAWLTVHFLQASEGWRPKLVDYLRRVNRGEPYPENLEAAFGMSARALGALVGAYWRKRKWPLRTFDSLKLDFASDIGVREMSEEETLLVRIKGQLPLASNIRVLRKMRKSLKKLLKMNPRAIDARTVAATAERDHGDPKIAARLTAEAAAIAPDSPLVLAAQGHLVLDDAIDTESQTEKMEKMIVARDFLRRAIKKNPGDLKARYYMARTYTDVAADEDVSEGLDAIREAVDVVRQNRSLRQTYAILLFRAGEYDAAEPIFRNFRDWTANDVTKKLAQRYLDMIAVARTAGRSTLIIELEAPGNNPD